MVIESVNITPIIIRTMENIPVLVKMLLPTAMAFIAVSWIYMKILQIAKVKDLMDKPNSRKLQSNPVPVLGGVAVIFGLMVGVITARCFIVPEFYILLPLTLCCGIILLIGVLDDILGLSAITRIIIEVLLILGLIYSSGRCIDSFHGMWGIHEFSRWIAVPFTVFAGVGIINAFNMVDGVNGLSSGLCITISLVMGLFFVKSGDHVNASLAFCMAGALIPFLLHNVFGRKSRMFIGDSGTMMMGLVVAWFVIWVMSTGGIASQRVEPRPLNYGALLLAVASVPIGDTLRVMIMRIRNGVSPFRPDKTHLHHKFIAVGISHSVTSLIEILIDILVMAAWYIAYKQEASMNKQVYVVIVAIMVFVWGTYWFLDFNLRHDTKMLKKIKAFSIRTHLGHTNWWLSFQKFLDKGAYEDYINIMGEKLNKNIEDMTEKEKDVAAVVNYLQGRGNVKVEDIMNESGAEKLRVYSILFELSQNKAITVTKCSTYGAPEVVKLNK